MILIAEAILVTIALAGTIAGTITDIQKREVADWVNYSMLASAILVRIIYSSLTMDWSFLGIGIAGLAITWLVALTLYYLGQWGGGDAKMLMAYGALLATLPATFYFGFLVQFFIYSLVAGAIMGVLYALYLVIKKPKLFAKAWNSFMNKTEYKLFLYGMLAVSGMLLLTSFFVQQFELKILAATLAIMLSVGSYLWIAIKAVEGSCMIEQTKVSSLVEGDWITEDIHKDKKLILKHSAIGVTLEGIKKLKEADVLTVPVKVGMPFVPAFLIGLVAALIVQYLI